MVGNTALALVLLSMVTWLVWVVRTARAAGVREVIRTMAIALLAGFATGLSAGGIARLTMRVVALAGFGTPRISVAGTVAIVRLGIDTAMALSLVLLVGGKYLRGSHFWRGLVVGVLSLVLVGAPLLLSNAGGEFFGPQAPIGAVLFTLLFLGAGLLVTWLSDRLNNYLSPDSGRHLVTAAIFSLLILPGLFSLWAFPFVVLRHIQAAVHIWLR